MNQRGRNGQTASGHSASFDPVTRRTVSAEIRQRLADAIHSGQLAPGTPLPAERVLCQEFGVARTSVRFTLSVDTTRDEIDETVIRIADAVRVLNPLG